MSSTATDWGLTVIPTVETFLAGAFSSIATSAITSDDTTSLIKALEVMGSFPEETIIDILHQENLYKQISYDATVLAKGSGKAFLGKVQAFKVMRGYVAGVPTFDLNSSALIIQNGTLIVQ